MTDAELLSKVKNGLGIVGDYQDETLAVYIADVKSFMISAGVAQEVADSSASVGCILRGVADLWNYGSGSVGFSEYFKMRVTQLAMLPVRTEAGADV
ncbi:MAG: phage gp6-like head-tail connector protein [Ruminococcus sp.]|nr:phage gp6-like head-tail connector protein [Ruminococcus sp.]